MADDTLKQPFYASADELRLYEQAFTLWDTLPADAVLTQAARLFNLAVAMAGEKRDPYRPARSG